MNHLDEGTIHAWLDGALDAERAREVEAHVRECATCSAAVAEARGLVAASSRILSALDAVPANVIPATTRAAPKAPTSPKRMWRAAPWVTGIAAVLLAAIVLRTTRDAPDYAEQARKMDEAQRSARIAVESMKVGRTEAAPALSPITQAPPPPSAASQALASQPITRDTAAMRDVRDARGAPTPQMVAGIASREAPPASEAVGRSVEPDVQGKLARSNLAQRQAEGAAGAVAVQKSADQELRSRAALAPAPTLADVIATSAAQRMAPPDSLPAADVAGCYAVEAASRFERVAAAVEAMAARKARAAAAPTAPAPAAAQAPVAAYAPLPTGLVVRLDTLRGRPGFIVRSATSDSSLGWWRRVHRDSARVDLLTAGVFTFTPARRIPCP